MVKKGGRKADSKLTKRMKGRGFLLVRAISEEAGVHRATIYRWIEQKHVKAVHINGTYYVSRESLREWYGAEAVEILDMHD